MRAPVAQWIERWPPEPGAWVRVPPGVLPSLSLPRRQYALVVHHIGRKHNRISDAPPTRASFTISVGRYVICDANTPARLPQTPHAALYAVIDTKPARLPQPPDDMERLCAHSKHARALAANARRHERALRPLQTRPPLLRDTPRRSSACSQRARRRPTLQPTDAADPRAAPTPIRRTDP